LRILPLMALAACHPEPELAFPSGFLWGSATAGFQVDMGCPTWTDQACVDENSDWYQWVTDPSITSNAALHVTGESVQNGPGMWELYERDIAQMAVDRHSAYRFSMEWSRLFPDGAAEQATTVDELAAYADPAALNRYHEILNTLAGHGIEPLVTLNHYVMPLWVHDGVACHEDVENCAASGWLDQERITRLIALYAGFCAREFGGKVDRWATLNEPFATTLAGYVQPGEDRSAPPGLSLAEGPTIASVINQIVGHARMYDAVHAEDPNASVGIVLNMVDIHPKDPASELDVRGAEHADHIYHRMFLSGLTAGEWDDDLDGEFDRTRSDLADRLDWIGINYYNQMFTAGLPFPIMPQVPAFDLIPEFSWEPHPAGLERVVGIAAEYELPILVTENGTPWTDRSDEVLTGHLAALHAAITAGADVRGYFYWSWVDNYEWNHGMDLQFGLYAFDPATKERKARPVAEVLSNAARRNGIDRPE